MAGHQEHVTMINGCWSGAPGVKPVAKIWQQHVALASHPPSMLLPGHASTNRKHTVDSPPLPASCDVIIGVSAPTCCTYTAIPVGVLSCRSVRGLNYNNPLIRFSWLDDALLLVFKIKIKVFFISPRRSQTNLFFTAAVYMAANPLPSSTNSSTRKEGWLL